MENGWEIAANCEMERPSGVPGPREATWGLQKRLEPRAEEGLVLDHFVLPNFTARSSHWTDQPMSEATCWLREFLNHRFLVEDLFHFGSHSCKTTPLTGRCTSAPVSAAERRLLGHHFDPAMKSVMVYSREAYTTLYAKVFHMQLQIRPGEANWGLHL